MTTTTKQPARRGRPPRAATPAIEAPAVIDLDAPIVARVAVDPAPAPAAVLEATSGTVGDPAPTMTDDSPPAGQAEHLRRGAEGSGYLPPASPPPCRHVTTFTRIRGGEVDRVCEQCREVTTTVVLSRYVAGAGASA